MPFISPRCVLLFLTFPAPRAPIPQPLQKLFLCPPKPPPRFFGRPPHVIIRLSNQTLSSFFKIRPPLEFQPVPLLNTEILLHISPFFAMLPLPNCSQYVTVIGNFFFRFFVLKTLINLFFSLFSVTHQFFRFTLPGSSASYLRSCRKSLHPAAHLSSTWGAIEAHSVSSLEDPPSGATFYTF